MTADGPGNPYGAIGYHYQLLTALVHLAEAARTDLSAAVEIETLDDFQLNLDEVTGVFQTKRHKEGSISNRSVDLWRTLAGWSRLEMSHHLDPHTRLYLITTATASNGSIASLLKESNRSGTADDQILALLEQELQKPASYLDPHFKAFDSLAPKQKRGLVARLRVVDDAGDIPDLQVRLEDISRLHVAPRSLTAFRERLEYWFLGSALGMLAKDEPCRMDGTDLASYCNALSQQFIDDNLPIDVPEGIHVEVPSDRKFVQAMERLLVQRRRIARNAKAWWLAREQRSRWLRDGLVDDNELSGYDAKLTDAWGARVDQAIDRRTSPLSEDDARSGGLEILEWAERDDSFRIRARVTTPWVQHGSLHQLADRNRIAWHLHDADGVLNGD